MEPILIVLVVAGVVALIAGIVIWRSGSGASEAPPVEAPRDLKGKLAGTRSAMGGRLSSVLGRQTLDDTFWVDLEETLIAADVGVPTAAALTEEVRSRRPADGAAALQALEEAMVGILAGKDRSLSLTGRPSVVRSSDCGSIPSRV